MDSLPSLLVALPILGAFAFFAAGWHTSPPDIRKLFGQSRSPRSKQQEIIHGAALHGRPPTSIQLSEILVAEGFGSQSDLKRLQESSTARSALSTLLEQERIDERRFTAIWSRASGVMPVVATPEDIDSELIDQWPETSARQYRAIPIERTPQRGLTMAFVEPLERDDVKALEHLFHAHVCPRLFTPSNFEALCDELYPGRRFHRRRIPFQPLFDSLDPGTRRTVRETQMTRRCTLGEAMELLAVRPAQEIREINALAHGTEPVDTSEFTLGIPILRTLTPLFCELHGILPLNNGALAVNHHLHPATSKKIHDILGDAAVFQSDTPAAFSKLWREFAALRFSQDALVEHLLSVEILSIANAQRIREARRLLAEPLDRVLLRLSLVTPRQIFHAIRSTSALDVAGDFTSLDEGVEDILTADHRKHSGISPRRAGSSGVTFHTARLPYPADSGEIMRRCDGVPWTFKLAPAWRDSIVN